MKRRIDLALLPVMILLLLLLLPPAMGDAAVVRAGDRIASPSDAEATPETGTVPSPKGRTASPSDAGIKMETGTAPSPKGRTASPSDAGAETETGAISYRKARIASPSDADPVELTDIRILKDILTCIQLLKRGESSASLPIRLDQNSVNFYREGGRFPERGVRFSVDYRTEDFDQTHGEQTGLFFLEASVVLEDERYALAPEVSADIRIPVFLYDPEQPSVLPFQCLDSDGSDGVERFHVLLPVHAERQQIADALRPHNDFYLYFEHDYFLHLPVDWDIDSADTDAPGIYTAYGRPALPRGVRMETIPEITCRINIQDPAVFTLASPTRASYFIRSEWLYPTPDKTLLRKWYRTAEGDWTVETADSLMSLTDSSDGTYRLSIDPGEMRSDLSYQFQLEYDGVYSDILELRLDDTGFTDRKLSGDRDGGDREPQPPPPIFPSHRRRHRSQIVGRESQILPQRPPKTGPLS